jgi:hypothetical protein
MAQRLQMVKTKSITFTTALIEHGSWGHRELGTHESTMDFWTNPGSLDGFIEWDVPGLETTEHIGLVFSPKEPLKTIIGIPRNSDLELVDYDGIMALPSQAIELLKDQGYYVPEEME